MTSDTSGAHGDDALPDRLRVRRRSPWLVRVAALAGLAVVATTVGYVATHPDDLPTSDARVAASTPVGQPVYVGVFQADAGFDRTLEVRGIKVFAESTVPVTITPHLCRGGSVGVTSEPDLFCSELVGTEGVTMTAGDEVVLEVSAEQPGTVSIERIRVAYRDGLQWATQFAGSPAVVTILSR
ncbi:hypothetical protein [Nocardioides sp.]|uniref:hypothetical protein n=1 Tax=Nocardioides sp. TaxID=35761 RepID=UPI001A2E7315|nr:hypothetical protein [Nocardioides sp.]MBJ7357522.1 hypothetical protein [Nocardioides sp.]